MYMTLLRTDNENTTRRCSMHGRLPDDGRTVTLTLKPGIAWSDGTQMTSADLVMSLTQYLGSHISSHAGRIGGVVGQDEYRTSRSVEGSGASRFDDRQRFPPGISQFFVSAELVLHDGTKTDARAGAARRSGWSARPPKPDGIGDLR